MVCIGLSTGFIRPAYPATPNGLQKVRPKQTAPGKRPAARHEHGRDSPTGPRMVPGRCPRPRPIVEPDPHGGYRTATFVEVGVTNFLVFLKPASWQIEDMAKPTAT